MAREREDGMLEMLVRSKGAFDGATSISEMAEMLDERAEAFRRLRDEEGWELENEVDDGFAYLVKENKFYFRIINQ